MSDGIRDHHASDKSNNACMIALWLAAPINHTFSLLFMLDLLDEAVNLELDPSTVTMDRKKKIGEGYF